MPLEQLLTLARIGQLKQDAASDQETQGLIRSGLARLQDAQNATLNIESRFDLAYNAAHALSFVALRKAGFRSESRYVVFQCLKHTLELADEQWRVLDHAHRKHNLAEYEGEVEIDAALLDALVRTAEVVAQRIPPE